MKSSIAAARPAAGGSAPALGSAASEGSAPASVAAGSAPRPVKEGSAPAPAAAGSAPRPAAVGRRQRNARGQGARLTQDIVSAALALIEREGSDEAVTLRAVAREIGIAAPSIYNHFPDRDAIVM